MGLLVIIIVRETVNYFMDKVITKRELLIIKLEKLYNKTIEHS